jgi:hypothetical protein
MARWLSSAALVMESAAAAEIFGRLASGPKRRAVAASTQMSMVTTSTLRKVFW